MTPGQRDPRPTGWPYRSEEEIAGLKRIGGEAFARDRWPDRCPDCQATAGEAHRDGCDWEICARCGGQRLACGCGEAA